MRWLLARRNRDESEIQREEEEERDEEIWREENLRAMRDELSPCREAIQNLPAALTCQCCLSWWPTVRRKMSQMEQIYEIESVRSKRKIRRKERPVIIMIIHVQLFCKKRIHIFTRMVMNPCFCCCSSSVILSATQGKSRKGDAGCWSWEFH